MFQTLDPLLETVPEAIWLTIGDGRGGEDSKYISDKGITVLPTDLSDEFLKISKKMGIIKDYRIENAEFLSFDKETFDFVLCKDSFHHFPRPMIALYEMLRVARQGIVLIEPNDTLYSNQRTSNIYNFFHTLTKTIFGKRENKYAWEESGNYVYNISRREIEKVALGLNYRMVAFKGFNDAYQPGGENIKLTEKSWLKTKMKLKILLFDIRSKLRLRDYISMTSIIFKKKPSSIMIEKLRSAGYQICNLPKNPYSITG